MAVNLLPSISVRQLVFLFNGLLLTLRGLGERLTTVLRVV